MSSISRVASTQLPFKSFLTIKWFDFSRLAVGINSVCYHFSPLGMRKVLSALYRFGPFELNTSEGTLVRNGSRVKLQDLPYRLLVLLVEHSGQIVSRETVKQGLWPDNTFVEFDNSLGVAVRKIRDALGDNAEAPRYLETLPRKGYRFLAPVTVIDRDRVANPGQAMPMEVAVPSVEPGKAETKSARSHTPYFVAVIFAVLLAASAWYILRARRSGSDPSVASKPVSSPVKMRRSMAVIGFRNLPGHAEDNWLSSAFAEMLNTELAADGSVRMISGEDVARAKRELPLSDEDSLGKPTLQRLRNDSGADLVVLGSYTVLPGKAARRIRLDVRVQDTARGETIVEEAFVGSEDDLFELVSQAGASMRQRLGTSPPSNDILAQVRAALPSKPLAVKLYTEGQNSLWAFDFVSARNFLIQAVATEPEFPLAHAALSDAWNHLGYAVKARKEVERAHSLSSHLGSEERLLIEALYYSTLQDRGKAIESYRSLFLQFPDNLDYGLRLADNQRWVNPDDALATLAALKRLPSPISDDARIDILEARALVNSDLSRAQSAARKAVQKGVGQGSRLLVARAYGVLCEIDADSESPEQTTQDCQNARLSYAAAGDRDNEARTINDFATFQYQKGDLDRAEGMFQGALRVFRETGDIEGIATTLNNLGDISLAKGKLDAATRELSEAVPGYREMDDKDGIALVMNDLGEVARRRGNLDEAIHTYEGAKKIAQEIDDKRAAGYSLTGIGDTRTSMGDFSAARASYEEALALRKQTGGRQTTAESELALAKLSVDEGNASDAEGVIRKCLEQFHEDHQTDDELDARVTLTKALLAESKSSDANKELEASRPLASNSVNEILRLQFDLASARAAIASEHLELARRALSTILQKARSDDLVEIEFEGLLADAELKRKFGESTKARTELAALEKKTRNKGFGFIAARALAARNKSASNP
jgi:eukaryotic-like serine/threonine-protein kinase